MTIFLVTLWLLSHFTPAEAQRKITDQSIVYQQERMVFKQWDRNKFTPKGGFLNLNPLYWITWALHPGYGSKDRRPLGPSGYQTQRMGLVLAMQSTEDAYKKQADTLRNTALVELANYSGAVTMADPLWILYYRPEFSDLLEQDDPQLLQDLPPDIQLYLTGKGLYDWVCEERANLLERLDAARTTDMDRGSRILAYHRLLLEYRKLMAKWDTQCQSAALYLKITARHDQLKAGTAILPVPGRSDVQIADDVLNQFK